MMSDEEVVAKPLPSCREAARYLVNCPSCGTEMQVVHLRYKHRCRVRKDPSARARQMHEKALVEFARRATTENLVDTI